MSHELGSCRCHLRDTDQYRNIEVMIPRAKYGWADTNGHVLSAGGDAAICCFKYYKASYCA